MEVSAEAVYAGLTEDQQAIARDVLRRMTAVGHDGGPTRRPVSRAELRAGHPKDQWAEAAAVLDALARSRLVVLRAGVAEIAHDVLLQAWPRLRDWLEEDQSSLILYGQLVEDTARWRQNGRDSSQLYRGVRLAAAREATRVWTADPVRYPALTAAEAEFLRASGRASTRGRWGRRDLAGALVLLLVAALAGAGRRPFGQERRQPAAHRGPVGATGRAEHRAGGCRPRSPRRCSPGPRGASHRPPRRVTASASPSPSRCAASWRPRRAR